MNPIITHKEYNDSYSITGEVFEESVIPKSLTPLLTRIRFINIETQKEENSIYFEEAYTLEELELEVKMASQHYKRYVS